MAMTRGSLNLGNKVLFDYPLNHVKPNKTAGVIFLKKFEDYQNESGFSKPEFT